MTTVDDPTATGEVTGKCAPTFNRGQPGPGRRNRPSGTWRVTCRSPERAAAACT